MIKNQGKKICKYHVKGECRESENCRFKHIDNICRNFFFMNGNCKHGEKCKFKHISNVANLKLKKKNTESFTPQHSPDDMTIMVGDGKKQFYGNQIKSQDVIVIPNLFCEEEDLTIYNKILEEIQQENVWKLWHGDTHMIADDKTDWKKECPTFQMVLDRIAEYFKMDIKATRLNWYRDSKEWKPYHHDAAAVKADKAKTQNFTVGVSFGLKRDASFEHARTRTRVKVPLPNGSTYTFSDMVNVDWRHGILQYPPDKYVEQGRISVIAWGKVDY